MSYAKVGQRNLPWLGKGQPEGRPRPPGWLSDIDDVELVHFMDGFPSLETNIELSLLILLESHLQQVVFRIHP